MKKTLKLKYVVPEVIDFKWMDSLGLCNANGSGDSAICSADGNLASNGSAASACKNFGNFAVATANPCANGNTAFS